MVQGVLALGDSKVRPRSGVTCDAYPHRLRASPSVFQQGDSEPSGVGSPNVLNTGDNRSTPIKTAGRMIWIDALRGLAILAVIFYHAHLQVTFGLNTHLGLITTIDNAISPFRMPILMFLSGVLLPLSLAKSWAPYIRGKVRKIAWPYVLWSFANLAILAAASPFREEAVGLADFAKVFYDPPTYHWYLAYLFVFYIVALLLARAEWVRMMTIPLALSVAFLVDGDAKQALFLWAFFMAGDAVALYWGRLKPLVTHPATIAICVLLTIPALAVGSSGNDIRYDPLWAISIFAAIFALRPVMEAVAPTSLGTILIAMGRQSVVYYVVHYLVVTLSFHILTRLGLTNSLALFFLITAIALLAGYILVRLRRSYAGAWLFEWAPRNTHSGAVKDPLR